MSRWLLTAVLLATQLSSWTAAPLYVCLASDGSVGMHLGAGDCGCDHDDSFTDHSECQCRHHHGHHHEAAIAHHHEHHSLAPSLHAVVSNSCGCMHIQISQPQGPTIVTKSTVAPDSDSVLSIAVTDLAPHFAPSANAFGLQPALFIECTSLPLLQLETVALRC
jgi:hypothetical protein